MKDKLKISTVTSRIKSIHLIDLVNRNSDYAKEIGVNAKMKINNKNRKEKK